MSLNNFNMECKIMCTNPNVCTVNIFVIACRHKMNIGRPVALGMTSLGSRSR